MPIEIVQKRRPGQKTYKRDAIDENGNLYKEEVALIRRESLSPERARVVHDQAEKRTLSGMYSGPRDAADLAKRLGLGTHKLSRAG